MLSNRDDIDDAIAELRRRFRLERVRLHLSVILHATCNWPLQAELINVLSLTAAVLIVKESSQYFYVLVIY